MGFSQCMKQNDGDFDGEDVVTREMKVLCNFEREDVVIREMKSLKNLSLNTNNNRYDYSKALSLNNSHQFDEKSLSLEKKNMEKFSEKLSRLDSYVEEVIRVIPSSRQNDDDDDDDNDKYLQRLQKFGGLITALSVVRKLIAKHKREINVDMEMLNNH
ncbi:hypothetical protein CsatB_006595 [Cannabis sativa]